MYLSKLLGWEGICFGVCFLGLGGIGWSEDGNVGLVEFGIFLRGLFL